MLAILDQPWIRTAFERVDHSLRAVDKGQGSWWSFDWGQVSISFYLDD